MAANALRWRRCWERLRFGAGELNSGPAAPALEWRDGPAAEARPDALAEEPAVPTEAQAEALSEGPAGLPTVPDSRFRVSVTGFQRGSPVLFNFTVRRGDAVWQIRRRYRQVWQVHTSLLEGLGTAAVRGGLPQPPPRKTMRSAVYGQLDAQFLEERSRQLESYINALLDFIPCVEMCEALYNFLCLVNQPRRDLDLLHGEIIGGGAPPVDAAAIAKLPRKAAPASACASDEAAPDEAAGGMLVAGHAEKAVKDQAATKKPVLCVICQEPMDPASDIRELPCKHEFHYACIEQWLRRRNTCCVCNGPGVLSAPRLI